MTKQAGYSLIEISIVLVIIGILAVMIAPYFIGLVGMAKDTAVKNDLKMIKLALMNYQSNIGHYPKVLEDLIRKPADKASAEKWHRAYLDPKKQVDGKIVDPWGQPYQYRATPAPGAKYPFELDSTGDPSVDEPYKISVWDI